MEVIHPQFIVDTNDNRKAVVLPYAEWESILHDLEELDDIRAYDQSKERDEEIISFDDAIAEINLKS